MLRRVGLFLHDRRATVSIDYGLLALMLVAVLVLPFVSIESFVKETFTAIHTALRGEE